MPKVMPFLWFDSQAEDAAKFYCSVIPNSKITKIARRPDNVPGGPPGAVMVVEFMLDGVSYAAMNGGSMFKLDEAFSLVVNCETQAEVDHYWTTLSDGGQTSACGWLKDRFGVSWQITPTILYTLMADPVKSKPAMAAMMTMTKLDIAALQKASEGA
jgi:predicted 3-demethylubiquinone-9 3-methyltransferase (glyoxalase superfamily)